jgi:hypothetical protein
MVAEGGSGPPLLVPYRAVGLVCDGVAFAVAQLGAETFVTTDDRHRIARSASCATAWRTPRPPLP